MLDTSTLYIVVSNRYHIASQVPPRRDQSRFRPKKNNMKNEQSQQQPLSPTCRSPGSFFRSDTVVIDTGQAQPTCLPAEEVSRVLETIGGGGGGFMRWFHHHSDKRYPPLITASGCFIALHWVLLSSLRCDYERRGVAAALDPG